MQIPFAFLLPNLQLNFCPGTMERNGNGEELHMEEERLGGGGAADTGDVEPNIEEEEVGKGGTEATNNTPKQHPPKAPTPAAANNYLHLFMSPKAAERNGHGRRADSEERGVRKKRDVIGNALRAGAARKSATLANNRRMSANIVVERFLDAEDGLGMESSSSWCPPVNADMPTPQSRMLSSLGGRLRALMGPNQSKQELAIDFGKVRSCRSHTDVNEEEEEKPMNVTGKVVSEEKIGQVDGSSEKDASDKRTTSPAAVGKKNSEFHDIREQKVTLLKSQGISFSIGSKFFRSRAKSEVNKRRETVYRDQE